MCIQKGENIPSHIDLSMNIDSNVIVLNQSRRCPIVLLVDTSESMKEYENLIKASLINSYETILNSRSASKAVELSVITFNKEVIVQEQMREIKRHEEMGVNINIHCKDYTLLGLGLKGAIQQIEGRKRVYANSLPKVKYYSPIIFLISDGRPECFDNEIKKQDEEALRLSKEYIKAEVAANRLTVVSVELGENCEHNLMKELTARNSDQFIAHICDENSLAQYIKVLLCYLYCY